MSKLGLTFLFAMAATYIRTVNYEAVTRRDVGLMSLTKGLHNEDWPQCRDAALQLAKYYGTQEKVQECLQHAVEDIMYIFGDRAGFSLMRDMKQLTFSTTLIEKLDSVLKKRVDNIYQCEQARMETIRYLSKLMFSNNWGPGDFDARKFDCKRVLTDLSAERITPDQFLARYRTVMIKIPPQAMSHP